MLRYRREQRSSTLPLVGKNVQCLRACFVFFWKQYALFAAKSLVQFILKFHNLRTQK